MNNGDREFSELLTSCERELTALKTSHRRPLGALNFYQQSQSLTIQLTQQYGVYSAMFWVDVEVQTPDVTPPILQIGWDVPAGFNYIDLFEYQINSSFTTWSYKMFLQSPSVSSATFTVTATSSLQIQSIRQRSAQ